MFEVRSDREKHHLNRLIDVLRTVLYESHDTFTL